MALVSITRLRVRSWLYFPMFVVQALLSARQAAKTPGNLKTRVLRDRRKAFWTGTVWTNETAMKEFMLSGVHRRVMKKLPEWCDEASLVHWTHESTELPTWSEAHLRLQREGRQSRVNHPSSAHRALQFPEPRVGRTGELNLK